MNPFLKPELQRNLVLASASERRREILERLGFEFEVFVTGIDEDGIPCPQPAAFAMLAAGRKASEAHEARPEATIIAADTIVVCGEARLGKPSDAADAAAMLRTLSGRRHDVITGVSVCGPHGTCVSGFEQTHVFFRELSDRTIARYIETGEPFGKAGAYAIQGYAASFVEKIDGCYFNVVGLPVSRLFKLLVEVGGNVDDHPNR
jgi:septum formation protein